jgi:acyl carrier protein
MAEQQSVRDRLLDIVGQQLGYSESQLNESGATFQSLGVDSLDLEELSLETEEEFDIRLSDGEIEQIATFDKLVELVQSKITD